MTGARLSEVVDACLTAAALDEVGRCTRAIVTPSTGLMYSGPVAAYTLVRQYRRTAAMLVGSSHFVGFLGCLHLAAW